MSEETFRIDHGIIEELMPSPVIPLETLLELRRLLDSIQAAENRCARLPVVQEAAPSEETAPSASLDRGRRQSRKQKNRNTSVNCFNNIPR